jgi:regulator of protease activity HflC (stomatin/prohibitin superfamily)
MNFIFSLLTSLLAIFIYLNSSKISGKRSRWTIRGITIFIGAIALLNCTGKILVIVPSGNVGVIDLLGRVSDRILNPGVHLINPFADVLLFSTRLKDIKENIDTTSREGLSLNIDVSLQYKLDPQKAATVYQNIGQDQEQLVISRLRSTVRATTAKYPAEAIYSGKRQEIAQQLDQQITQQLLPLGLIVEEVLLRNVKMPDSLQAEIQEKLKAEQESQKMKFILEKERQEAQRKLIEAKGIADSQKIISKGLTNSVLQLRATEAMEKLAQSPNSKIIVLGVEKAAGVPVFIPAETATAKP